jgi:hypothetical protein
MSWLLPGLTSTNFSSGQGLLKNATFYLKQAPRRITMLNTSGLCGAGCEILPGNLSVWVCNQLLPH